MAAVANRSVADAAIGLIRRSVSAIRTLSSAAAQPAQSTTSAGAADVAEQGNPKRKKKKNLFEVAQFLPNWGVGYKMAKSHWRDVSYEITKINLYKDGRHGKAWGIRHKAGIAAADEPVKISGVNKRGWKYIREGKKKATETNASPEPNPA